LKGAVYSIDGSKGVIDTKSVTVNPDEVPENKVNSPNNTL